MVISVLVVYDLNIWALVVVSQFAWLAHEYEVPGLIPIASYPFNLNPLL